MSFGSDRATRAAVQYSSEALLNACHIQAFFPLYLWLDTFQDSTRLEPTSGSSILSILFWFVFIYIQLPALDVILRGVHREQVSFQ